MNAYGQPPQQQYGYGMPPQAHGGAPRGSSGLAKAAIAVLALRVLLSLGAVVVSPIIVRSIMKTGRSFTDVRAFYSVQTGLFGLVVFVAAILFMLYLRSEVIALRAAGIPTKYTPGWAIGWWFIPFANFVMPLLVVLDVWKHRLPRAGAAVPVLWWVSYMLATINTSAQLPVPYLGLVLALAAYGLWATVTYMLMTAPAVPAFAPPQAYGYGQQPYAPPPAQPGYYPPG